MNENSASVRFDQATFSSLSRNDERERETVDSFKSDTCIFLYPAFEGYGYLSFRLEEYSVLGV